MSQTPDSAHSSSGGDGVTVQLPRHLVKELQGMFPGEDIVSAISHLKEEREHGRDLEGEVSYSENSDRDDEEATTPRPKVHVVGTTPVRTAGAGGHVLTVPEHPVYVVSHKARTQQQQHSTHQSYHHEEEPYYYRSQAGYTTHNSSLPYPPAVVREHNNSRLLVVNNPTSLALSYFTIKVSKGRSQDLVEIMTNDRTLTFAFAQQVVIDRVVIQTPGRRRGPGGFVASVAFDSEYIFGGEGTLQVTDGAFEQSLLLAAPVRNRAVMGLQLQFSDPTQHQLEAGGGGGAHLLSDSALNALMNSSSNQRKPQGVNSSSNIHHNNNSSSSRRAAFSKNESLQEGSNSRGFEVSDVILHGHFF